MAKTKRATIREEVNLNRRRNGERRVQERRTGSEAVASERRHNTRRKVQRRRQIDPTTCERDYSVEEIEFMRAMDEYKRASGRMFPTCSEVLEVVRSLGYVQGRIPPGTPASDPLVPLPPAEPAPSEQETAGPC